MSDVKAWAECCGVGCKGPYGLLTTVILALTPLFLASAILSWKLAKMIEARETEEKKKQKRQENIAKAKRLMGWGFSPMVLAPALQAQGLEFDRRYQKKKAKQLKKD
ncbi:small integral membrane protein 15-like [Heterocephalus glaber]|uniref:Small integral membrane protein 15 n=1 Tax=Heterocephalus glaber TaxID=10181 RepID=A0AAX6T7H2_HETGA|nr:small integral membrane protein 15-like [Heterocephalus glaber]